MGQKTHPTGFRLGVIKPWQSSWFANKKEYPSNLAEDAKIRKYLKKKLASAGISRIVIDRKGQDATISLIAAKPGVIVGRGGQGLDDLRKDVSNKFNRKFQLDVLEVDRVDADAQLVSEAIAQQLEKRVVFRRAMKMAIQRSMRAGVLGIKVAVSGRLGGAEIARAEHYHEGTIPMQTLRADIDYGFWEANTTYGKIGVKCWIYKGEVLNEVNRPDGSRRDDRRPPRRNFDGKRDDRRGERRERRDGNFRNNRQGGQR